MMDISYELVRSTRKTIAIQITPAGQVIVRAPKRIAKREIEAFVHSKQSWIQTHLSRIESRPQLPPFSPEEVQSLAASAKADLSSRVARLAPLVGVTYGRITIRSQRTRWGSCSAKGNLNFNCLLLLCPEEVRDYVVIHELCHRKQLNHSPAFWAEVERACPDYRSHRAWLKANGSALIRRLPQ